jgi:hypothetical protein
MPPPRYHGRHSTLWFPDHPDDDAEAVDPDGDGPVPGEWQDERDEDHEERSRL